MTLEGGAANKWLPPMKCEGRLYFAALLLGVPFAFAPLAAMLSVGGPAQKALVVEKVDDGIADRGFRGAGGDEFKWLGLRARKEWSQ